VIDYGLEILFEKDTSVDHRIISCGSVRTELKDLSFFLALQPHDMLMIESGAAAAYVLDVPITTFKSR